MQVGFITNLKRILAAGEDRALLISATGTGKTYASAFAMRELRFKRVLFLVHRGQLARQTKKSYEKVFAKSVSMGLVGAGYHEYNADYVFATVQTLKRDEHLLQYAEDTFDCIILDEAQNTTPAQMKMFLTRIGFGSKVVITGDSTQKDLPSGTISGLDVAVKVVKDLEGINICTLTSKDVVRHPLVQKIVKAYEDYEKKSSRPRENRRKKG